MTREEVGKLLANLSPGNAQSREIEEIKILALADISMELEAINYNLSLIVQLNR